VKRFLKKNRRKIKPVMFPARSPELNPLEECWNIGREYLLGSTVPDSFEKLRREVSEYYRTKKFHLNIINCICP
jgi:hypothetical protein